jgi:HD superfamily phosphohydrolase
LPSHTSELRRAKKIAQDYQNRELFKCVYERILTRKEQFSKIKSTQLKKEISKRSKVDENEIFVDSSITPSIPLTPSKKESKSLILVTKDGTKVSAKEIPISQIPLVSTMSGFMNILRVYTYSKNRKKVEIAAKSILGGKKT